MGTEIELKYTPKGALMAETLFSHALVAPFCGKVSTISMSSTYFDTDGLASCGEVVSLRMRDEGGRRVVTAKTSKGHSGALSERGEWSVESHDIKSALIELRDSGAPIGHLIGRRLNVSGAVVFQRTYARVSPRPALVLELAHDDGVFSDGERFCDIELELIAGDTGALEEYGGELARALGLMPEPRSKRERAAGRR